ncbi:MAG TPA: cysteine hydrolase [Acidimicrobiales bacterium]|nr:cysteine hydrolase [Acidimicrobiales bacterium]
MVSGLSTALSQSDVADRRIEPSSTALVLVGFQNEYFGPQGGLRREIDDSDAPEQVLSATVGLIGALAHTEALIVSTPIVFTPTYEELINPVGVLAAIKAKRAFQRGTEGARLVAALEGFGARIADVPGRRGLNAFLDSGLDELLGACGIVDVVLAGALACVNVDSSARSAHERGYRVSILSDCTLSRTESEHDLFCRRIFPLYAEVLSSLQLLDRLGVTEQVDH